MGEKMDWADKKALELMLQHVNCEVSTQETCELLAKFLREAREAGDEKNALIFLEGIKAAQAILNSQGTEGLSVMLSDLTQKTPPLNQNEKIIEKIAKSIFPLTIFHGYNEVTKQEEWHRNKNILKQYARAALQVLEDEGWLPAPQVEKEKPRF